MENVHIEDWQELPGTKLSWRGIRGWIETLYAVDRTMRLSSKCHARADRLYRWLTVAHIRSCRDEDALRDLAELLRISRFSDYPFRHGLARALSRTELGELIVEAENQALWVSHGCPDRNKGPTLDPRFIPDDRIDFLIQRHQDMTVVEALRQERARRAGLQSTGT